MTYAVRYYTKTGNTKKLAQAVADELGVEALPISEPIKEHVDLLFLGNSYYVFTIDPEVKAFVGSLVAMDEKEFHCKGEFKGIHKGRPNEDDLHAIAEFARQYK